MSPVDAQPMSWEHGARGSITRAMEHAVSVGGMPRTLEQLRKRLDQMDELDSSVIVAAKAQKPRHRRGS
jgi:hypothetical protein